MMMTLAWLQAHLFRGCWLRSQSNPLSPDHEFRLRVSYLPRRQRAKVARALDTTEQHVWPEVVQPPRTGHSTDRLAGYAAASDLDAPDWKTLMREATENIELLGDTLIQMLGASGVAELLTAKAANGCEVRILLSKPGRHLAPYVEQKGIEVRAPELPARQTIYRFEEQLLLLLHLQAQEDAQAPLVHLQRRARADCLTVSPTTSTTSGNTPDS